MFVTNCGTCGRDYQLHDDKANKRLKCKECGETFVAKPAKKKQRAASSRAVAESKPEQLPSRVKPKRRTGRGKKAKHAAAGRRWPMFVGIGLMAAIVIAAVGFLVSRSETDDVAGVAPNADSVSNTDAGVGNEVKGDAAIAAITSNVVGPESALNFKSQEDAADGTWRQAVEPRQYPSLPDAISTLPTWLVEDPNVPFDIAEYATMPTPEENAAPLYLDAFYEFSSEVADCFPEPERARRTPATEARTKRLYEFHTRWYDNHSAVSSAEVDSILKEYEIGFQKLQVAQQRPQCVILTGVSIAALLPHLPAVRNVSRVACMRAWRLAQQGNLDAAIAVAEDTFRLARDIVNRGQTISAFVAIVTDAYVCESILRDVLLHPDLTTQQCDRLLSIVSGHEQQQATMWRSVLQGEYVMARVFLHDIQFRAGDYSPEAIDRFGLDRKQLQGKTYGQFAASFTMGVGNGAGRNVDEYGTYIDSMTPNDFTREVAVANATFVAVFDAWKSPVHERRDAIRQMQNRMSTGHDAKLFSLIWLGSDTLDEAARRNQVRLAAFKTLICVRRWQLEHGQPVPPDLATAWQEAGVTQPVIDGYGTGEPLRLTAIAGQPVVYSVGPDGLDQNGLRDWSMDPRKPGDWTFRMESWEDHNRRQEAAEKQ